MEKVKLLIKNRQAKNIAFSLLFRIAAIASNFIVVPLLVHHFSEAKYGILVTIISISSWFSYIDFGLANGLKNKISESLAEGDLVKVKKYVSTAYVSLVKVSVCLAIILLIADHFINWNSVIKAPQEDEAAVNTLIVYGLLFFYAKLLVELINPVLLAFHKTAISSFIAFVSQLSILCVCYVYKFANNQSLVHFGLAFFWVPFVVVSVTSLYFYSTSFRHINPAIRLSEKKYEKELFNLGGNFFIIQLAVLIVFTTDNLIVGRVLGYEEVSKYNIAYRYFNIPIFIFSIILSPYWTLFAQRFAVKNLDGIKKIMDRLLLTWIGSAVFAFGMLLIAPFVYEKWIGKDLRIPFMLNLGMCLFAIITSWNNVYVTFINGTNKLRVQLLNCVLVGVINIPLSLYLAKNTALGAAGVIFSTCICLLVCSVWAPIQYYKLINNKATGLWNR